jgi:hypothetical protein
MPSLGHHKAHFVATIIRCFDISKLAWSIWETVLAAGKNSGSLNNQCFGLRPRTIELIERIDMAPWYRDARQSWVSLIGFCRKISKTQKLRIATVQGDFCQIKASFDFSFG